MGKLLVVSDAAEQSQMWLLNNRRETWGCLQGQRRYRPLFLTSITWRLCCRSWLRPRLFGKGCGFDSQVIFYLDVLPDTSEVVNSIPVTGRALTELKRRPKSNFLYCFCLHETIPTQVDRFHVNIASYNNYFAQLTTTVQK